MIGVSTADTLRLTLRFVVAWALAIGSADFAAGVFDVGELGVAEVDADAVGGLDGLPVDGADCGPEVSVEGEVVGEAWVSDGLGLREASGDGERVAGVAAAGVTPGVGDGDGLSVGSPKAGGTATVRVTIAPATATRVRRNMVNSEPQCGPVVLQSLPARIGAAGHVLSSIVVRNLLYC
ncbi:hypothetical protein [Microlunatus elymi]|uniref:hypothetical protein n=1 Tax=Microlunatus elymi TaxID=2596828 RepID=UPI00143D87B2|nr:hypothetical protein [Microlunatus elymi]